MRTEKQYCIPVSKQKSFVFQCSELVSNFSVMASYNEIYLISTDMNMHGQGKIHRVNDETFKKLRNTNLESCERTIFSPGRKM